MVDECLAVNHVTALTDGQAYSQCPLTGEQYITKLLALVKPISDFSF